MTKIRHLVLLPGMDGTGILFQPFLEKCFKKENFTIISYPVDRHIPYSGLLDYVVSRLPKDKDIVLLGESFSGPVAIQIAAQQKFKIHGLILVATFSTYPNSLLKFISHWFPYKYLLRLPIPDYLLRFICFDRNVDIGIIKLLKKSLSQTPTDIIAKRMFEGVHIDVRDELTTIQIPCIYIKAKFDRLVSARASQEIKELNKSIKIIEINGPHCILQTRIKECCLEINKLL